MRHWTRFSKSWAMYASAAAVVAGIAFMPAGDAEAQNDTFEVSATVGASCTISAADLAFGAYDPVTTNATTPLDGQSDITVTCTDGETVTISLDTGDNADTSTPPVRRMLSATTTDFITYELYSDSGRNTRWDDTDRVTHNGTGVAQTHTVYGQVDPGQTGADAATDYTDTITATINF